MDRLTKVMSCPDGAKIYDVSNELFKANCSRADKTRMILEKLAYYENLEEQGRLVKLPCKVGDTVYKVDKVREKIKQYKVIHFETDRVDFDNYDSCFLSHFGKTVFLTKEEAEAELNSYLKKYNKDIERD